MPATSLRSVCIRSHLCAESPLDILKGNNGYEEFVRLVEGIIHGDFA
jgi:hypothetical protein